MNINTEYTLDDLFDRPVAPERALKTTTKAWRFQSRPIVGLVAAKNPVSALVTTVGSLFAGGASTVVVVNDGSDSSESLTVFDEAENQGAKVIHLPANVGKSNALRAGFTWLTENMDQSFLIAQVDDDTFAGDLSVPAQMIADGKADIVDIRVETFDGKNLVGLAQQLDYWLINATIKRGQDWLRARLWLSGASVMYTSEAAEVMLMQHSVTQTEDTEGRFRAIGAGLKVRYCSSTKAQFKTMVPETARGVAHQWQRWAIGNGQVIGVHGLGGGNPRIALVNLLSWIIMIASPLTQFFVADWLRVPWSIPGLDSINQLHMGLLTPLLLALIWMGIFGIFVGVIGAIKLRRVSLVLVGWVIPLMSLLWTVNALVGVALAVKNPRPKSLTWTPPKRMEQVEVDA